jgi:hypothetical protein
MGLDLDQTVGIKIQTFKEDLENELLELVEIVLLNKYGYTNPKERATFE